MKKELLDLIVKEAYFKQKVILSSGKESDYYLDIRRVTLHPQGLYQICHMIWRKIKDEDIAAIGGPTLGADPIVGGILYLAHKNGKKLKGFLIRKTPKEHGRQQLIEGQDLLPGEKVILFDDVATSGSSIIKSIEVLKSIQVKPIKAFVVVDRQEGAAKNLAAFDCPLEALFTARQIKRASGAE